MYLKKMNNSTKKSFYNKKELTCLINSYLSGSTGANEADLHARLLAQSYSDIGIRILKRCVITRAIACAVGRLYMMYRTVPTAALMLIDRRGKIKNIVLFAEKYRPRLSEFSEELCALCKNAKVKKCIVIFNYRYRDTEYRELLDINRLYKFLDGRGIRLLDAISVANGEIYSPIYALTKTYDR